MKERKIVLLIDAENTSARYAKGIMEYLGKKGDIICARIYGDFINNVSVKGWNSVAIEYEMEQKQQLTTSAGKNSSDIALVIDAMDLLYQKSIDTLCIVTSDGDFTGLVKRIREDGIEVIGMGKADASKRLEKVCDQYLDIEELEEKKTKGKEKPETKATDERKTDKTKAEKKSGKGKNGGKTESKTNWKEKEQKEKKAPKSIVTENNREVNETENKTSKANREKKSKSNVLKVGTRKSVWGGENTKASGKKEDSVQSVKAETAQSTEKTKSVKGEDAKSTKPDTSVTPKIGEIKSAIQNMVQQEERNGKHAELGGVKSQLQLKYPGFDEKAYGYKTIRELIEKETKHEIVLEGRHTYVIPKKTSIKDFIRSKSGNKTK